MNKPKTDAEPTFDEEMTELEKAVRELESGKLGLDDSLQRFERGIALARKLRGRLDAAEGRVEQLLDDGATRSLSPG